MAITVGTRLLTRVTLSFLCRRISRLESGFIGVHCWPGCACHFVDDVDRHLRDPQWHDGPLQGFHDSFYLRVGENPDSIALDSSQAITAVVGIGTVQRNHQVLQATDVTFHNILNIKKLTEMAVIGQTSSSDASSMLPHSPNPGHVELPSKFIALDLTAACADATDGSTTRPALLIREAILSPHEIF